MLVFFLVIGLYAIIISNLLNQTDIQSSWDTLSYQSRVYYYNNNFDTLMQTFLMKMTLTGALYLFIFASGVIILIFSYQFYYLLKESIFDWRPPLRSRLNDERAKRYIYIYAKYNSDYKRLYDIENNDQKNINPPIIEKIGKLDGIDIEDKEKDKDKLKPPENDERAKKEKEKEDEAQFIDNNLNNSLPVNPVISDQQAKEQKISQEQPKEIKESRIQNNQLEKKELEVQDEPLFKRNVGMKRIMRRNIEKTENEEPK